MSKQRLLAESSHRHIYVPSLFIIIMVGALVLESLFSDQIYFASWAAKFGLALILSGTALLYFANKSVKKIRKDIQDSDEETEVNFFVGPFAHIRHPGYVSLALIGVGFSLTVNSFFILAGTAIFYMVARIMATKEEKHFLEDSSHVGEHYSKYVKKVKRFL